MKILTKEIEKKLPKLYSQDGKDPKEVKIIAKIFTPDSHLTFFITEGEKQDNGDYLFFGLTESFEKELGYFTLRQLEGIRGKLGLPVERDRWFAVGEKTLAEVM
jgi:hypothetical protein